MIIVKPEGAATCHRAEREFMRAVHDQSGVYIANVNVPNSSAQGAFTREVDGVMLTPHGIYTVEVKSIRASGELHAPRMDGWSIVDGDTRVPLMGRPHAQALAHSKFLASFLKDTGVAPGWIRAVLAIVGDGITLPEGADVFVADNVYVVVSQPGVGDIMRQQIGGAMSQRELSVELVQEILTTFGCVESAPTYTELATEGFRTEADIEAEVEIRRQQVREEFLAAASSRGEVPEVEQHASGNRDVVDVLDAPSSLEWRITEDRYASAVALDDELTETGAFVDGVAMHRRLISYAERKGVDLSDVAYVVNNPVEVLGDDSEVNIVYCGPEFAVSVRALDGLAMFYKPVADAMAERVGATVDGVEITARAAKQAINQFSIPLEAVARIVSGAEEKWWMPGTTDIAHARGEFVAVTSGHVGPVLYVQTRAMAVSRCAPKPEVVEKAETKSADVVVGGLTIRASAVAWCNRRNVPLSQIEDVASRPTKVWAGHSENMEVRSGPQYAVLLDVADAAVVAVMTAGEAVEYRDGVVRDGVRLSGRCVFLTKRRKVSVEDIIAAFVAPTSIARAPGSGQSVFIGTELAVTVEDETNTVVDFTYAGHALAMVRRQELVPVDLSVDADVQVVGESSQAAEVAVPVAPRVGVVPVPGPRPAPTPAVLARKGVGPQGKTSVRREVSPLLMATQRRSA